MAREVIQGPWQRLQKCKEDNPEWVSEAHRVISEWGNSDYLVTVVAKGLKEAYERGVNGLPPPKVTTLDQDEEEEVQPVVRRTRTRKPAELPTTRKRRTTRAH